MLKRKYSPSTTIAPIATPGSRGDSAGSTIVRYTYTTSPISELASTTSIGPRMRRKIEKV